MGQHLNRFIFSASPVHVLHVKALVENGIKSYSKSCRWATSGWVPSPKNIVLNGPDRSKILNMFFANDSKS